MYEKWCETCERPMKCHNEDGTLYCIGCKQQLASLRYRSMGLVHALHL